MKIGFFLLLRVQCEMKEMDWAKKLLCKDDLGLDDLGNSQPFQIAKIRRVTCSREKAKSNTGQPFASISEGLKFQSIPSHRGLFKRLGIWLTDSPHSF